MREKLLVLEVVNLCDDASNGGGQAKKEKLVKSCRNGLNKHNDSHAFL